ncbi:phospholipase A [Wolinella succinogenes]|uniref:phospholipase A n=1 Tax=Wolinella succinogenes TaxID=844 RepID=UPI00240928C3|nr:phospholipase A [Wolinella succinogenes]
MSLRPLFFGALFLSSLLAEGRNLTLWLSEPDGTTRRLTGVKLEEKDQAIEILLPAKEGESPRILHLLLTDEENGARATPLIEQPTINKEQLRVVEIKPPGFKEESSNEEEEQPRLYREYHDRKNLFGSFLGIIPHHPNYILPFSHSLNDRKGESKKTEAKFQISFKTLLAQSLWGSKFDLYLAYTQRSYWQVYDGDDSRPFRESNYEPEIFLSYPTEIPLFGGRLEQVNFGLNHESNGKDIEKSRSWNRAFIEGIYNHGNLFLGLKGWYRLPEKEKSSPLDPNGDDNPDIHNYLGYGDLKIGYLLEKHLFTATLRNNLRSKGENRGSLLLDYSYPIQNHLYFYLQYFSGYGESLIDYNRSVERIGAGFLFTR